MNSAEQGKMIHGSNEGFLVADPGEVQGCIAKGYVKPSLVSISKNKRKRGSRFSRPLQRRPTYPFRTHNPVKDNDQIQVFTKDDNIICGNPISGFSSPLALLVGCLIPAKFLKPPWGQTMSRYYCRTLQLQELEFG